MVNSDFLVKFFEFFVKFIFDLKVVLLCYIGLFILFIGNSLRTCVRGRRGLVVVVVSVIFYFFIVIRKKVENLESRKEDWKDESSASETESHINGGLVQKLIRFLI